MKYYIEEKALIEYPVLPTGRQVREAILENNSIFTTWRDTANGRIYVECENKPRDMPIFGIEWKEEK